MPIAEPVAQLEPKQNGAWVFIFPQRFKTSIRAVLECRSLLRIHIMLFMNDELVANWNPLMFLQWLPSQISSIPYSCYWFFFSKINSKGLWFYLSVFWARHYIPWGGGKEREKERECTGMENFFLTRPQQFLKSSFGIAIEPVYVPYNKISLISL